MEKRDDSNARYETLRAVNYKDCSRELTELSG